MPAKNSIVRTPCSRWLGLGAIAVAGCVFAAEPHLGVDLIAPTILTLHFDTDPLRSYTVQFNATFEWRGRDVLLGRTATHMG